jgi:cobalamin biosynthesis Mg chelatase CobN
MGEPARALDDVSDHLGEVLRRADELLADWSRFGAQVRTQVDHEVAAIGEVIDGAVVRAASSGVDRAIADRLRALTTEIERLEHRTRAASRAVTERREADRRVLWIVVAGIVLANALLVALLLRRPEAAPVAEPIRMEVAPAPAASIDPPTGSAPPAAPAAGPASATSPGSAGATGTVTAGSGADPNASAAAHGGASPSNPKAGPAVGPSAAPASPGAPRLGPDAPTAARPGGPSSSLPAKPGAPRIHKKLP